MFDGVLSFRQQKREAIAAENRDKDFQRERHTFAAAANDPAYELYDFTRNDLIIWQQDLDGEVLNLIQKLKGRRLIEGKWLDLTEPLCNDLFICQVVEPQVQPFISRNLFNTCLDERRILELIRLTLDVIADSMADNFDVYGIKFENFDQVINLIKMTILPGPYRALHGWTKKTDNTVIRRIEAFNEQTGNNQKLGLWGGMFKNGKST